MVDVPREDVQPVTLQLLQRVAEQQNDGPAGALLAEVRSLQSQMAQLQRQLEAERAARVKAETKLAHSKSVVPFSPSPPTERSDWHIEESPTTPPPPPPPPPATASSALVLYEGPPSQCTRNPWCARGFKHGGVGGRCSALPTPVGKTRVSRGFPKMEEEEAKHRNDAEEEQEQAGEQEEEEEEADVEAEDEERRAAVSATCEGAWQKIELRCAITMERLTDPARIAGCTHPCRVNFSALANTGNVCPVVGCSRPNRHRLRVRDHALRSAIQKAPHSATAIWVKGGRVRMTAPPRSRTAAYNVDG